MIDCAKFHQYTYSGLGRIFSHAEWMEKTVIAAAEITILYRDEVGVTLIPHQSSVRDVIDTFILVDPRDGKIILSMTSHFIGDDKVYCCMHTMTEG